MNTVRWNIAVSPDVDQSVRVFIAAQGGSRKDDLSRFIEEARARLYPRARRRSGQDRCGIGETELNKPHRRGNAVGAWSLMRVILDD